MNPMHPSMNPEGEGEEQLDELERLERQHYGFLYSYLYESHEDV